MNAQALSPTRYMASITLAAGAAVALLGAAPGPKPQPARPTTLRIVARDYGYDLPATVPSGATRIELVNRGQELHHAQLVRLEQGKTLQDLARLPHDAPPPPWVVPVGGPGAVGPGDSSAVIQALLPGNYAVICFIPAADHQPHVAKGMAAGFTVTEKGNGARVPVATSTVRLVDFGFAPSHALKPGRQLVRVVNDGVQPHEIVVFRLLPGKTLADLQAWQMTLEGPPPAEAVGGTVGIAQHGEAVMDLELEAGQYAFTCFLPDVKSGKPHFMHGMTMGVVVR